ncbi:MAG: hypothetical protein DA408_10830 [Bacteroidetes bacterium]|nr:MAG: hypothetical protein C7N36_16700 [Bacteroidota bacterium]PTM12349.1 MAG: hypothetical protein DA408_10830 [Bacteroidota bacterium]
MKNQLVLQRMLLLAGLGLVLTANPLTAQVTSEDLSAGFHWRNIGPANQGGRIVDIEAVDNDFRRVFLATGSGGVWRSDNAGNSWTPIFDRYETSSIGDIALFQPNPDIIWVGTGEANNRNSVSWGNGVYKSSDGGQNFRHLGLANTHQIARVLTHPRDSNTVYVGAIGHLWGTSGERGVFKTTDGGKNWQKLTTGLPNDGLSGCTDLVMDPRNPQVVYAAFYERLRQPWTFQSGGTNGGIFKSTNGGKSWVKLTQGLPPGPTGRIGLAIYQKDPRILMALVEAEKSDTLSVPGSGLYRSADGGKSWTYVNIYNNRPFYYSQVRINPHDDQRVYLLTTRLMVSADGGKTLTNGSEDQEVHGDFHAMWLDPRDPDRYYLGADKGASLTHDHGQHFLLFDNLAIGQFYRIGADHRDPYYVYGGLQDNGTYGVASFSRDARGILNDNAWKLHWGDGQFIQPDPTDWRTLFTEQENGSSYRYDVRTHKMTRIQPSDQNITNYETVIPDSLKRTGREFRYNWTAPLVMSKYDPHTLFAGSNYLLQSMDQGQHWTIISPDLSIANPQQTVRGKSGGVTPDNTGAETHCAIYTFSESPLAPAVLWVGTDDGNVQVTQDGGQHWRNVRRAIAGVPEGLWVSRVEASHHAPGRAYVTFDGHRSDNFAPWVFRTDDYGESWTNLGSSLPDHEVVRVVREDSRNADLLFLGTETGIWASVDAGQQWFRFMPGLPTVPVYDLLIHPRDHDLIAGTHGRSLWILDDLTPLQQLTPELQTQSGHLFEQRTATLWENTSRGGQRGHFWFAGENPPTIQNAGSVPRARFDNSAAISYFVGKTGSEKVVLEIRDRTGQYLRTVKLDPTAGIHRYYWDLEFDALPYTETEARALDDQFKTLLETYRNPDLQEDYDSFRKAKTPRAQRRQITRLRTGFPAYPFDERLGLPVAGAGVYLLTLRVGAEQWQTTLTVREDPLGEE